MSKAKRQVFRFLATGLIVVVVDAGVYASSLGFFAPSSAKAIAFVCGTIVAYLINKFWTFEKRGFSVSEGASFLSLYVISLGINVGINEVFLRIPPYSLLFAYLCATTASATFNFLGQKYVIFSHSRLFFGRPYVPPKGANRMRHVGDVEKARMDFFAPPAGGSSHNLRFLLEHRYTWMNDYLKEDSRGVEVGSGAGISKAYIRAKSFLLTDYADKEWLDVKNVDALRTPFAPESFDFVVSSNMIHHVPYPMRFFEECQRILKPGGALLIQEINASFFMRFILWATRHEGYSFDAHVFDRNAVCTDPHDLWSANCAIPNLLFDDPSRFARHVPYFEMVRSTYSEFFLFLNSGGVIAKTFYVPLPLPILRMIRYIDTLLATLFPDIFALQRQVVLRKRSS